MAAYPVMCLVDLADGYRTSFTIEDGDVEEGSIARMTIQSEHPAATIRVELSPDAVEAILDELTRRLRALRSTEPNSKEQESK